MDRRTFVVGSVAAANAALAGCSSPGEARSLGTPRVETDAEGTESHLVFERSGNGVLTITYRQRALSAAPSGRYGLRVTISHSEDTRLERFRFDFKSPPDTLGVPADIFLKQPDGGPWPDIDFGRVEGQWTRVAVEGLGDLGDGTLGFEIIVAPLDDGGHPVAIRSNVTLVTEGLLSGGPLQGETQTEFQPVLD
ncbi:hypothetical protein [Salinibaculum salinum]|uniref:hypothetical protein n=1 Tax=Salinibaculum salinum TaxID=3131996 RepID=UPI0030EEBE9A